MDIQGRVVDFYKNNQFIQKYLKGIDPNSNEVVLGYNNDTKRMSIDALESIKDEESLLAFFQGKSIPAPEQNSVNVNSVSISPVSKEQSMLVNNIDVTRETLNDIKILNELKNKEGLDNLLKKFSVNSSTGLIDINQAISKITRTTMNEVEKAIRNNYEFSKDETEYDIEGNFIGTPIKGTSTDDEKIVSSFKNIKVYLDTAKMYPEQANYNEEQINNFMKTYISKVKEELYGKKPVVEPSKVTAPVAPKVEEEIPVSQNAGFADIFVLTVIVMVYAVIIVNLVLKIK